MRESWVEGVPYKIYTNISIIQIYTILHANLNYIYRSVSYSIFRCQKKRDAWKGKKYVENAHGDYPVFSNDIYLCDVVAVLAEQQGHLSK